MSRLEKAVEEALKRKGGVSVASTEDEEGTPLNSPPVETPGEGDAALLSGQTEPSLPPLRERINELVVRYREDNPKAAEEYGKIKSRLMRIAERDSAIKRLLITSALKGEGKSLTTLNLAISLARSYEQNVLMLDTDLRNPSLHKYLGLDEGPGLIQCFRDNLNVRNAIVETGISRLKFLPAGGTVSDPVELLSSSKPKEIFSQIQMADPGLFMLFDAPPILPFADVHSLLPEVGGVILVVREGFPSRKHLTQALDALDEAHYRGVIFNGASTSYINKEDSYGYSY